MTTINTETLSSAKKTSEIPKVYAETFRLLLWILAVTLNRLGGFYSILAYIIFFGILLFLMKINLSSREGFAREIMFITLLICLWGILATLIFD